MSGIPSTPYKVFLSHAHADNELCDRYVDALKARGLDVWYDRNNLQDGQFLSQEIETQLRERMAFVWMITPASLASYWVRLEVGAFRNLAAQDSARLFLPVRVAYCEMPVLVAEIKWIDAFAIGFDAAVNELAATLRAYIPSASSSLSSSSTHASSALHVTAPPTDHPAHTFVDKPSSGPGSVSRILSPLGLLLGEHWGQHWGQHLLTAATWLDPNNAQARAFKSVKLAEQGRQAEALAELEKALELDPDYAFAWALKGEALHDLRRLNEAVMAFDRALALDIQRKLPPWFTRKMAEDLKVGVWASKAQTLHALGRHSEEVATYDQALAYAPADAGMWEAKGKALRELGRDEEANFAAEQARKLRDKTHKDK